MKKIVLAIALLSLFGSVSYAQESGYSLSAALVGMKMDYREYDQNDLILDSEKSDVTDIIGSEFRLAYRQTQESENIAEIGVDFQVLGGETEYVGSLISSGLGYGSYVGKTHNVIYDMAIDYRFSFIYENGLNLNCGLGLGYRYWRRELSAYQVEVYSWYSVRPQLGISYKIENFSIGILGEYQYGFETTMDILENSENSQKSVKLGFADIIELNIPIEYTLSENLDVFMHYTYQQQRIGASNVIPYVINGSVENIYEPKSTANNQYIKLGIRLKF
jgi:hypothetical protein